jgi:hypothetical protein
MNSERRTSGSMDRKLTSMYNLLRFIFPNKYATDRELLQAQLYALAAQTKRLDRLKRQEYHRENVIKWKNTLAAIDLGGVP